MNIVSYILQMREQLEKMSAMAQENMEKAQKAQKKWYDQSAQSRTLDKGEQVLLLVSTHESS